MASKKPKTAARKKAPTPDQRRARQEMSALSAAWNDISDEQRQAWEAKARSDRRRSRAARSRRPSGRRLFFKANSHRFALGQPLLPGPSGSKNGCPTPLARLRIINRAGRMQLKLRVILGQAAGIMLSSWHPCNAGVMVWKKFVRIGLLPAPSRETSDFTKLYVAKFGVPPVGKKVFVRLQQMNEDSRTLVYITSAIVRGEEGWPAEQKTPQTIAKP